MTQSKAPGRSSGCTSPLRRSGRCWARAAIWPCVTVLASTVPMPRPMPPTANSSCFAPRAKSPGGGLPVPAVSSLGLRRSGRKRNSPPPTPSIPPANPTETRRALQWLLGDGPAYEPAGVKLGEGESDDTAKVLNRLGPEHLKCRFAQIDGNFYYPPGASPNRKTGALKRSCPPSSG